MNNTQTIKTDKRNNDPDDDCKTHQLGRGLSAIALHNPAGVQVKIGQKGASAEPEKRS